MNPTRRQNVMYSHFSVVAVVTIIAVSWLTIQAAVAQSQTTIRFPVDRPPNGNVNRPWDGDILDVSPPGFCWWRAGQKGSVSYRIKIVDATGKPVDTSEPLEDPVYIPNVVLPPATYAWIVEAIGPDGSVLDTRPSSSFTILDGAKAMPWVEPKELLSRVPADHPRLLFPKASLKNVRATLATTRKETYRSLRSIADEGLAIALMERPDFDKYKKGSFAQIRTAYREAYREFQQTYNSHVVPMALVFLLSGEKKYGEAARVHLLNLLDWPLEGVTSVQDPRFDEVGLNIAHTAPQIYDWCYDLFTDEERVRIEEMLVARGNLLLARMERRDFLNASGESHDGRVPGYLLEFSIALAHRPEAVAWLEYGLKSMLTVFPHWGDKDGGWAEGVNYALSYSDRFLTPLQSLAEATGYDLWEKSFFRKFPYFLFYCASPRGEISPFGDMEHTGIASRADNLYSILHVFAERYQDPIIRWWLDLFDKKDIEVNDGQAAIHRIIFPVATPALPPTDIVQDRFFEGIGWAAMHSDLAHPDEDLLLLFKCSPFGQDSHSHADQNSFAIMKGGRALALPSGARYPQQGSPFHTRYTIQTIAHNAIMVNGNGQITKDESAVGRLVAANSSKHIGYAAGEAEKCYGPPVTRYIRHLVFVRPSLIVVLDDLDASEPVQIDWLLHGKERFDLDQDAQTIVSHRNGATMHVRLLSPSGFALGQDDAWPIDPKEGYPMVTEEPPARQWHFTGRLKGKSDHQRIAAIMTVSEATDLPSINVTNNTNDSSTINVAFQDGSKAVLRLDLSAGTPNIGKDPAPLLDIRYESADGSVERLTIPPSTAQEAHKE